MTEIEFQETIRTAIGTELRRLRRRAGLTAAEVARRTRSHRPVISRIESGLHTTSIDIVIGFAEACGGGFGHVLLAIDIALGLLPRRDQGGVR